MSFWGGTGQKNSTGQHPAQVGLWDMGRGSCVGLPLTCSPLSLPLFFARGPCAVSALNTHFFCNEAKRIVTGCDGVLTVKPMSCFVTDFSATIEICLSQLAPRDQSSCTRHNVLYPITIPITSSDRSIFHHNFLSQLFNYFVVCSFCQNKCFSVKISHFSCQNLSLFL